MNKEEFKTFCQKFFPNAPITSPLIMGIVNVTPDSFSDGGSYLTLSKAFDKTMELIAEGADLIDIGGESSRPGARPISTQEELDRVLPLIEKLGKETKTCLSIDTTKPEVMKMAVGFGAGLINDVHALQSENALETAANLKVPVVLMHRQGSSETMQEAPFYPEGLMETINNFFAKRIKACMDAGIPRNFIVLDPGFGFGKTPEHNIQLIKHWSQFHQQELPLMLGVSRKQTLGILLKKNVNERLTGGLVLMLMAAQQGLSIIRTHDVRATKEALVMFSYLTTG